MQSLIAGTIATIRNLVSNPGEHFSSLDDVLAGLSDFNIRMLSQSQQCTFKANLIYEHLNHRFADATVLEAFSMFDGRSLLLDEEELHVFGKESLIHYQSISNLF